MPIERILQTPDELKLEFKRQIKLLKDYAEKYDNGENHYATEMAVKLRLMLHETGKSKSLVGQLLLRDRKFYDTGANFNLLQPGIFFMSGISSLTYPSIPNGMMPFLDGVIPGRDGYVDFSSYWNRVVMIDNDGTSFTRAEIIGNIANQDGGAHVDPGIDKKHYELSRHNTIGIELVSDDNTTKPVNRPDFPVIRQITHEILKTFMDYQ